MSKLSTEQFIQEAAARNWSKTQTLEALGMCKEKFYAILEAMPPLAWPARGKSVGHIRSNESRRGVSTQALRDALVIARASRKAKHSHEVGGVVGTIEEHAARSSVSASTVRRRMNAGMDITEALTTPATPLKLRRNGYGTHKNGKRVEELKTLTIRMPWAWAIIRPDITDPEERAAAIRIGRMKLIENRTWHTKFRGRFLVHAAQGMTRAEYSEASWLIGPLCGHIPPFEELQRGGIVGSVELVDSVDDSGSPWYAGEGSKPFVLPDPKPIQSVRCKGQLQFWDFPGGEQLLGAL